MESMTVSDWITAGLALAALIVAAMSWWSSRTSARASVTSAEAAVKSAISSETSAGAAVRSADAAEKSASAEHELLRLELEDRGAAEHERRTNIWEIKRANSHMWTIRLTSDVAYQVDVDAHGAPIEWQQWNGGFGPVFKRELLKVIYKSTGVDEWDRKVTISWSESELPDGEILRKDLVL
jgi:hypothetical protein